MLTAALVRNPSISRLPKPGMSAENPAAGAQESPTTRRCTARFAEKTAFLPVSPWHGTCSAQIVVSTRRARLSAIGIIAVMLLAVATPLVATESGHRVCLAKHHDCGQTLRVNTCCRMEPGDRSDDATPAAAKTQIAQPVSHGTMVLISAPLAAPDPIRLGGVSSPPRSSPPDLITLFGTFLI
jgi:hypothetical protein